MNYTIAPSIYLKKTRRKTIKRVRWEWEKIEKTKTFMYDFVLMNVVGTVMPNDVYHSLQVDLIWNQSVKFYEIITSEIRRRTRINIEREWKNARKKYHERIHRQASALKILNQMVSTEWVGGSEAKSFFNFIRGYSGVQPHSIFE